jgi:hypothetical protein
VVFDKVKAFPLIREIRGEKETKKENCDGGRGEKSFPSHRGGRTKGEKKTRQQQQLAAGRGV